MIRLILSGTFFISLSGQALAHAGHLGELAGHAHWLGLGAAVAAGAIAAVLGKLKASENEEEASDPEAEAEEVEAV